MSAAGGDSRRELARRSVSLERVASLLDRGRDLAVELAGTAFASIAAGEHHALAIRRDGSLWSWGWNVDGQLGLGGKENRYLPTRVREDSDWAWVSAGCGHSLALKRDGSLWAWGSNGCGQLGLGDMDECDHPVRVGGEVSWATASAGAWHTLAIGRDGSLWAWGYNEIGQLGLGDWEYCDHPVRVGTDNDWSSVCAGDVHSLALKCDGSLWRSGNDYVDYEWGSNNLVQVDAAVWASIACGGHCLAVRRDGSLWAWGTNYFGQVGHNAEEKCDVPTQVGVGRDWASAAAGGHHSLALRRDGSLWTWGCNSNGELGSGDGEDRDQPTRVGEDSDWHCVTAGHGFSLALKRDGSIWSWGLSDDGRLGLGDRADRRRPTQVGSTPPSSHATLPMPSHEASGSSAHGVVAMACGDSCCFAIRHDGTLWAWGENGQQQLGLGPNLETAKLRQVGERDDWVAMDVGSHHAAALARDGSLWTAGTDSRGELGHGLGSELRSSSVFTRVGAERDWSAVACGGEHSLALKTDGTLWGWGSNRSGQLGLGHDMNLLGPPCRVGRDCDWWQIACGGSYSVAIRRDGTLWQWGILVEDSYGDPPHAEPILAPRQIGTANDWILVSCSYANALAVKRDGTLWGWGTNQDGALGLDNNWEAVPEPVQVGTDCDWRTVACGAFHTLAVKHDGSLWAWGDDDSGELGDGSCAPGAIPVPLSVDDSHDWRDVAAGAGHSLGLKRDGTLWAWGIGCPAPWDDHSEMWDNGSRILVIENRGLPILVDWPSDAQAEATSPSQLPF